MRPSSVVPKTTKATKGKKLQQQKMSSKATKAKEPLTQANPKFVMGKPMLIVDTLHKAGQPCVDLHNYYINNYNLGQDIILSYKDHHFLMGDGFFVISFFNLYDLFNLDMLDVSLMCCFTLYVCKTSFFNILNICV
jgi:hypothetical protein